MRVLALPSYSKGNHYIHLLYNGLTELDVEIRHLSWGNAKQGADICHIHWPDLLLTQASLLLSVRQSLRLFFLLLWLKVRWRTKVVWTVHNLEPHEKGLPLWWRRLFYFWWLRAVDGCIFMSEASREAFEAMYQNKYEYTVIPHGHYCDVYEQVESGHGMRKRLGISNYDVVFGHYGQIRDYKNVPYLMREFSKLKDADLRLVVAGKLKAHDVDLLKEIEDLAGNDTRIHFIPGFLSDSDMKELYQMTDWAVLPYKFILNSGSAVLSLSLGCPALVPDLPTMHELQQYVGSSFVKIMSERPLRVDLEACLAGSALKRCQRSDLQYFEWSNICESTKHFFREML